MIPLDVGFNTVLIFVIEYGVNWTNCTACPIRCRAKDHLHATLGQFRFQGIILVVTPRNVMYL